MNSETVVIVLATVLILTLVLIISDRVLTRMAVSDAESRKVMSDRIKLLEGRVVFLLDQLQLAQNKIAQMQVEIDTLRGPVEIVTKPVSQPKLRVLALWPTSTGAELDFKQEQRYLRDSNIDLVLLKDGNANKSALVRELSKGDFDIVQISAHGSNGEIMLSDGIVTPGWLEKALSNYSSIIQCVVLLACETSDPSGWNASDALISAGIKYVVGVSGDIPDLDAINFSGMFYSLVSRGISIEESFNSAKLVISTDASDMLRLFKGR